MYKVELTCLAAVLPILPRPLDIITTRGAALFRSSGKKARVTISCDVIPLLYRAFAAARMSDRLSEAGYVTLAALLTRAVVILSARIFIKNNSDDQ